MANDTLCDHHIDCFDNILSDCISSGCAGWLIISCEDDLSPLENSWGNSSQYLLLAVSELLNVNFEISLLSVCFRPKADVHDAEIYLT